MVTVGRTDSNIDVVLLFLHRPRSPQISKASVFPCEEEEKQETDSEMNSQQRFETEVKKTKGAQEGEGKWAETGKQSTSASFSFSFTSLSLSVCHAAAHINIIHCCLMSYHVAPDQQGQAEHLRMLCSFTVCNLERCVSNRSSKVSVWRAGHKDYSHFLPS